MKKNMRIVVVLLSIWLLLSACSEKEKETKKPPTEKKEEQVVVVGQAEEPDTTLLQVEVERFKQVQNALNEGYKPIGTYVPGKGYRFVHPTKPSDDPMQPNGLLYGLDENANFVFLGVEWVMFGEQEEWPTVYEGVNWYRNTPAGGHYEDGSFEEAAEEAVLPVNPVTNAKLAMWLPSISSITLFLVEGEEPAFQITSDVVQKIYDETGVARPMTAIRYVETP